MGPKNDSTLSARQLTTELTGARFGIDNPARARVDERLRHYGPSQTARQTCCRAFVLLTMGGAAAQLAHRQTPKGSERPVNSRTVSRQRKPYEHAWPPS